MRGFYLYFGTLVLLGAALINSNWFFLSAEQLNGDNSEKKISNVDRQKFQGLKGKKFFESLEKNYFGKGIKDEIIESNVNGFFSRKRVLAQDYYSQYLATYNSYLGMYWQWLNNFFQQTYNGYFVNSRFPPNSQYYDMSQFRPPAYDSNIPVLSGGNKSGNQNSGFYYSKVSQSPPSGRMDVPYLFGHPVIFNGANSYDYSGASTNSLNMTQK